MLVIRLFRTGKRNQAFFKIVVVDKRKSSKGGRFNDEVGFLNPKTKEKSLNKDKIKHWLSVGAKPSATIYNLLVAEKIVEGKKIAVHKKSKKAVPVAPVPATPAPVAAAPAPVAPQIETSKTEAPKLETAEPLKTEVKESEIEKK
jgi:small subunit ribosomal protein S16